MNVRNIFHLKMYKQGSTLLFVLLITSCLLPIALSHWHSSVRNYELIFDRIRYEQNFRLTDGAVRYGIAYAKNNYELLKNTHDYSFFLDEYAHLLGEKYHVELVFLMQKKSVCIKAITYTAHKKVYCIQCRIQKGKSGLFEVKDWKIVD